MFLRGSVQTLEFLLNVINVINNMLLTGVNSALAGDDSFLAVAARVSNMQPRGQNKPARRRNLPQFYCFSIETINKSSTPGVLMT